MKVHLVDGTYELFRQHFGRPSHLTASGVEVSAVRGVLGSLLDLVEGGATHLGVATDHVIESFRNQLWPGYKTGEDTPPELASQFGLVEEAVAAMGVVVWPMVELEADDALASAASVAAADERVSQVLICTADKDLAQCVVGTRVVRLDRRRRNGENTETVTDEAGVWERYGVAPTSIPDWLALVGDSSDGFAGLPGWGPKSAATLLAHYGHLEAIPDAQGQWAVSVRGGSTLAATLSSQRELAMLFRDLATLRVDPSLVGSVDQLAWTGPTSAFAGVARQLESPALAARATRLATEMQRP
ncbi:MAG: 5'-3' exonuclease [Acidimicrobiales bacterium]